MLEVIIPGFETLKLKKLVLDLNGTLATDGVIPEKVIKKLNNLKQILNIFIITAGTHGKLEEISEKISAKLVSITELEEKWEEFYSLIIESPPKSIIVNKLGNVIFKESHLLKVKSPLLIKIKLKNGSEQKRDFVNKIGAKNCICIGNGSNDTLMFKECKLSIAVMGQEGLSTQALKNTDILVKDICDALDMLFNPKRITATLRQ
jgi:soluble P-type ATPase